MVTIEMARTLALNLPEVEEKSHFDRPDFRLKNKVFASLHADKNTIMIKLSAVDQSVFCLVDEKSIYPVPGGWGKKGATFFRLDKLTASLVADALKCGWKNVASKTLINRYFPELE